jgi:hypothetical protein
MMDFKTHVAHMKRQHETKTLMGKVGVFLGSDEKLVRLFGVYAVPKALEGAVTGEGVLVARASTPDQP